MTDAPINTFVIPHLNNQKGLLRCLETLYQHTPDNFRVILIDQSADDTLYDKIKDRVHVYMKVYRNLGFAKAANMGIKMSDTEYVTILNDDVEFIHMKWWDGVMKTFTRYDADGPQTLVVNPSSMRKLNGAGEPVNDPDFEYKESWTEDEYDAMIAKESGGRGELGIIVDGITPWCATFHRQGVIDAGLFDEAFWPGGGEDYDLQNRAYLKHKNNGLVRYRCLGSSLSMAWHWWCTTKNTVGAFETFVEASNYYQKKWGTPEHPNPYPNGTQSVPIEELKFPEATVRPL